MIKASYILESIQQILEARVVYNIDEIERRLTNWGHVVDQDPRIVQWIRSRLRKYILNDYDGQMWGLNNVYLVVPDETPQRKRLSPGVSLTLVAGMAPDYVKKAWDNDEPVYNIEINSAFEDKIFHVFDYFKSDYAPTGSLTGLSVPDAIRKSEEWTEQLARKAKDEETAEDVEVIAIYGSFSWVELLSERALSKETKYMSHCVGDPKQGYLKKIKRGVIRIFSLRDSANKPHCTLTLDNGKYIEELSGKGNGSVDSKYIPLVKRFLNEKLHPEYVKTDNLPGLFWSKKKNLLVEADEIPLPQLLYAVFEDELTIEDFGERIGEIIAKHGRDGTINQVWEKGKDWRYPPEFNALWFAVYRWYDRSYGPERIEQIVKAGGKDMVTAKGTALEWAVREDYRNIIELLLTSKASDPNVGSSRYGIPLFVSVCRGVHYDEEIVDLFLACPDLNINQTDDLGRTPVYYTCLHTDTKGTKKLLERGADPNKEYEGAYSNKQKVSLLELAINNNDISTLRVVKDYVDLKRFGPRAWEYATTQNPLGNKLVSEFAGYLKKAGVEVPK